MSSIAQKIRQTVLEFIARYGPVRYVIVPPAGRFGAREAFTGTDVPKVEWIIAHDAKGNANEWVIREREVFNAAGLPHVHCFKSWAILSVDGDLATYPLEGDDQC